MVGTKALWVAATVIGVLVTCVCGLVFPLFPERTVRWISAGSLGILTAAIWLRQKNAAVSARKRFAAVAPNSDVSSPDSQEWTSKDWKAWAAAQADILQSESEALAARERRLTEKLSRYHEILEFPDEDSNTFPEVDSAVLSDADNQVLALLEAEAASVYEKIRTNAYMTDGSIDLLTIRRDTLDLVQRIAKVYQPDSRQPLLETSFNQLARAFSRICLHCLVLLEQLPLDVRNYTLNELFKYFHRAARAYGAYQTVSPWLKRLGRSAYAGRLAAGANPVTLGAWWLASEVAQRGTQHVVANVVDRQAIAVLHDLVSVVGTEVANIYGPGYRQRDAAWVYGSELTELLSRFPVSRASLTEALQEITRLPLKCEYDRIYLYRCLGTSKPAGFLLTDPASLTREQRETIATALERFVNEVIHGIDAEKLSVWANETEDRLDLKLKLDTSNEPQAQKAHVLECLHSIRQFCVGTLTAERDRVLRLFESLDLLRKLDVESRQAFLGEFNQATLSNFSVPNLDPDSRLLPIYLNDLYSAAIATRQVHAHHFQLLMETGMHFRRSKEETLLHISEACRRMLLAEGSSADHLASLDDQQVVAVSVIMNDDEIVADVFPSLEPGTPLPPGSSKAEDAVLAVLANRDSGDRRIALVATPFENFGPWSSVIQWQTDSVSGYVYDDCRVIRVKSESEYSDVSQQADSGWSNVKDLLLNGTLLNRRFENRFASLLLDNNQSSIQ